MIKLYRGNINDNLFSGSPKSWLLNNFHYDVIDNGDSIDFKIKTYFNRNPRYFEVTINIEENKGKEINFVVIPTSKAAELKVEYVREYIDRVWGGRPLDADNRNRNKIGKVVIEPDGTTYIGLALCFEDVEGFDNEVMDLDNNSVSYYFLRDSEWYRNRIDLIDKKRDLISQTDIYKSASYLEAQVDLLTNMVIDLVNGKEVDKDKLALLETANKYSVLNIKPDSAISEEFSENKAKFRELQEKYYDSLNDS